MASVHLKQESPRSTVAVWWDVVFLPEEEGPRKPRCTEMQVFLAAVRLSLAPASAAGEQRRK